MRPCTWKMPSCSNPVICILQDSGSKVVFKMYFKVFFAPQGAFFFSSTLYGGAGSSAIVFIFEPFHYLHILQNSKVHVRSSQCLVGFLHCQRLEVSVASSRKCTGYSFIYDKQYSIVIFRSVSCNIRDISFQNPLFEIVLLRV